MVFCTLYDFNYIDKGLVMYDSLVESGADFKLYVLSMDDKCYKILKQIEKENLIPVSLDEFETDELKQAKKNRSRGEYCWTCSSAFIEYVLENRGEDICTYIDADMFFYSNPQVLIDEMGDKEVQIIEHRFTDSMEDKMRLRNSGRFCVEFNTFRNTDSARKLLSWWKQECINCCNMMEMGKTTFGDQKYLEGWEKYPFVQIIKNEGAGIAPWNVAQYKLDSMEEGGVFVSNKACDRIKVIFYHFHKLEYIEQNKIKLNLYENYWKLDDILIGELYGEYLKKIEEKKKWIRSEFGSAPEISVYLGQRNDLKIQDRIKRAISADFCKKLLFYLFGIVRKVYQGNKDYYIIINSL